MTFTTYTLTGTQFDLTGTQLPQSNEGVPRFPEGIEGDEECSKPEPDKLHSNPSSENFRQLPISWGVIHCLLKMYREPYIGIGHRTTIHPAAFQDLFGLQPSHGRMPYARAVNSVFSLRVIANRSTKVKRMCGVSVVPSPTISVTSKCSSPCWDRGHGSVILRSSNRNGVKALSRRSAMRKNCVSGS